MLIHYDVTCRLFLQNIGKDTIYYIVHACWRYSRTNKLINKWSLHYENKHETFSFPTRMVLELCTSVLVFFRIKVSKIWFFLMPLLTCFRPVLLLCGNQSADLHSKSMDWFLHNADTGLKWVKYYHCLLLIDPIEPSVAII